MSQNDRNQRFIKDTASFSSLNSFSPAYLRSTMNKGSSSNNTSGNGPNTNSYTFASVPRVQTRYGHRPYVRTAFTPLRSVRSGPSTPTTGNSGGGSPGRAKRIVLEPDFDSDDGPAAASLSASASASATPVYSQRSSRKRRPNSNSIRVVKDERDHGIISLVLDYVELALPAKSYTSKHKLLFKVSGNQMNWSMEILNLENDNMVEECHLQNISEFYLNLDLHACLIRYMSSSTNSPTYLLATFPNCDQQEMRSVADVCRFSVGKQKVVVDLSESEFLTKCQLTQVHLPAKSHLHSSPASSPASSSASPARRLKTGSSPESRADTSINPLDFYGSHTKRSQSSTTALSSSTTSRKGHELDLTSSSSDDDNVLEKILKNRQSYSSLSPYTSVQTVKSVPNPSPARSVQSVSAVRTSSRLESQRKKSNTNADEDFKKFGISPMQYIFEDKKSIDVTLHDFKRLAEGEYLNDTLINFFSKIALEHATPKTQEETYLFNSYFYERYTTPGGGGFDSVKKWTSKVNIFEKKYLIFPINARLHWYLIIICNLPELLKKTLERDDLEETGFQRKGHSLIGDTPQTVIIERQTRSGTVREVQPAIMRSTRSHGPITSDEPVILILDSIRANSHGHDVRRLREYLVAEAKDKLKITLDKHSIRGRTIAVPQQPNYCDCGIYLIHYMEKFTSDPYKFLTTVDAPATEKNEERLVKFWDTEALENKRDHLRHFILTKKDQYTPKLSEQPQGSQANANAPTGDSDLEAFEEVGALEQGSSESDKAAEVSKRTATSKPANSGSCVDDNANENQSQEKPSQEIDVAQPDNEDAGSQDMVAELEDKAGSPDKEMTTSEGADKGADNRDNEMVTNSDNKVSSQDREGTVSSPKELDSESSSEDTERSVIPVDELRHQDGEDSTPSTKELPSESSSPANLVSVPGSGTDESSSEDRDGSLSELNEASSQDKEVAVLQVSVSQSDEPQTNVPEITQSLSEDTKLTDDEVAIELEVSATDN